MHRNPLLQLQLYTVKVLERKTYSSDQSSTVWLFFQDHHIHKSGYRALPCLCVSQVTEPVFDLWPGPRAGCDRRHHPRGQEPSGSKPRLEILQRKVGRPQRSVRDWESVRRSTWTMLNSLTLTVSLTVSLLSYGEALFMNSKLIGGVTEFLNTERELQEVKTQTCTRYWSPAGRRCAGK